MTHRIIVCFNLENIERIINLSNTTNLAPFNNFIPHCPFCGEQPKINPCNHLKAFVFIEEPEEGSSNIVYLSDDFLNILESTLETKLIFSNDKDSPDKNRRLHSAYYFDDIGKLEDSNHLVELANALEGAVCFQQSLPGNITRSITFAISSTEHETLKAQDQEMIVLNREIKQQSKNGFKDSIKMNQDGKYFLSLEESETLEFKQTFEKDTRLNKLSKDIKAALIREITGFLNTRSGIIVIGVHDTSKEILGIEHDGYDGNKDNYSRRIMNFLKDKCGETAASLVKISYESYLDATICILECQKSNEPIYFLDKNNNEIPLVRTGSNTTQPGYQEWEKFQKQSFRPRGSK